MGNSGQFLFPLIGQEKNRGPHVGIMVRTSETSRSMRMRRSQPRFSPVFKFLARFGCGSGKGKGQGKVKMVRVGVRVRVRVTAMVRVRVMVRVIVR